MAHQYLDLLRDIKEHGDGHDDRTGVGTKSLFGYQMKFDLAEGFPLLTTKKLSFRWIAEELFWFLSGATNVEQLRNRCIKPITIWDDWATKEKCAEFNRPEGELGPIYGHAWRNFGATKASPDNLSTRRFHTDEGRQINLGYNDDGVDQLRKILDELEANPNSRRLIISGWDPAEADQVSLPPCHTFFQLKWHEDTNKLDMQLYQRSADVFLGVPYNIASYALLTCIIAKAAGRAPGTYTHTFGDVHIYKTHHDAVNEQLKRTPAQLPRLTVRKVAGGSVCERVLNTDYTALVLEGYAPEPSIAAPVAV